MDSYRVEAKAALKMAMADADATVEPVPPGGGGGKGEADIDKLSAIIKTFNDLFELGNTWKDEDKIRKVLTAQANSDKQNAKLEHDKALNRVVLELLSDHTELFKRSATTPALADGHSVRCDLSGARCRRKHRRRLGRRHEKVLQRQLQLHSFCILRHSVDATYQRGAVPPKAPPSWASVALCWWAGCDDLAPPFPDSFVS
jgi:hypothetical protein